MKRDTESLKIELRNEAKRFPFVDQARNKTFFITGATGFLGSAIVYFLQELNALHHSNIKIVCQIRDLGKANKLFAESPEIEYIVGDMQSRFELPNGTDYIFHCASATSSRYFIEHPIDTFLDNICMINTLAQKMTEQKVRSFVYLSSLEVYGTMDSERKIDENSISVLQLLNTRNSYPLAKIASEELLYMYFKQYGLPVKIARLTQTFGTGVEYDDDRVFAQFARCAAEGKDIVLKSKGKTKRCYCYITDAINALFYILINGVNGEAYNVASDDTYISILDLAKLFCTERQDIRIKFELENESQTGYLPVNKTFLDNNKLKALGWQSANNIYDCVKKLYGYFIKIAKGDFKDE